MSSQDHEDGYFGRSSNNTHTYDYQQGRAAHDKMFGTNYSGLNPPKPKPYKAPSYTSTFGPAKSASIWPSATPTQRVSSVDQPSVFPTYSPPVFNTPVTRISSASFDNLPAVSSVPSYSSYGSYDDYESEGRVRRISRWMIEHIWPLSKCEELGRALDHVGGAFKCIVAVCGALALLAATSWWPGVHAVFAGLPGNYIPWVAVACGAVAGFVLPKVLGKLMLLLVRVIAAVLFVAGCAAVAGAVYAGVVLVSGRHLF